MWVFKEGGGDCSREQRVLILYIYLPIRQRVGRHAPLIGCAYRAGPGLGRPPFIRIKVDIYSSDHVWRSADHKDGWTDWPRPAIVIVLGVGERVGRVGENRRGGVGVRPGVLQAVRDPPTPSPTLLCSSMVRLTYRISPASSWVPARRRRKTGGRGLGPGGPGACC